jgi:5'-nucleotidase
VNDDGIYSPGIAGLASVARRLGEVRVVAPDVERSSAGHSITSSRPVRARPTELFEGIPAFRVNGTPADCVALGVFLWDGVDVVLSGVNLGPNLGNAIWHSGTLAGAKQATLLGIRGIALSAPVKDDDPDFTGLEPWIERVVRMLLDKRCPRLVNVNFPLEPTGVRWTAQSVEQYDGKVVPGEDPMGRRHYWYTVVPLERWADGTDLWAVARGYVSMTPLRLDLTDHEELERVARGEPIVEGRAASAG